MSANSESKHETKSKRAAAEGQKALQRRRLHSTVLHMTLKSYILNP